jgi:hypothetical protein
MSISTKAFPTLGGWHPSYKELFLEFTGSDGKKYRTGLRPKEYPFYAGVPIVNGVPDFSQAVFLVDKYGNVRMKNAYIEGTIIAGIGSEIDWSYVKNVLVQTAQIADLAVTNAKIANIDASKITTGYLSADRIAARSITADKLNVSQLSAISANLGTITAGNIYGVYIEGTTIQGSTIRTAPTGQKRIEIVPSSDPNNPNEIIFYKAPNAIAGAIWLDVVDTTLAFLYLYGLTGIRLQPFGVNVLEANYNGVFIAGCYPWSSATYNLGSSTYKWANLYLSGNAYVDRTVNTTYLAAGYLSQSLNANGYNISNIGSLYCNYLYAGYLGQALNANGYNISNVATLSCSSLSCSGTVYGSLLNIGASSTYNYIAGTLKTYSILPVSNNYYELGSSSYKWYRIYVSYINGVGDIILENHIRPASLSLNLNVGTADYYFNEINAKYFTDRGCLAWFEDGVELNDGRKVSDLEAIKSIKPSEKKKTIYGVPQLDYSTLPKVVYRPAPIDEKGNKQGEDGAELTALISIILGAIKELDKKVENLENKFNELEKGLT